MKIETFDFVDYDPENDSLFIVAKTIPYKHSVGVGNVILDISMEGTLRGIEILGFINSLGIDVNKILEEEENSIKHEKEVQT